jgi:hypothetical protein
VRAAFRAPPGGGDLDQGLAALRLLQARSLAACRCHDGASARQP